MKIKLLFILLTISIPSNYCQQSLLEKSINLTKVTQSPRQIVYAHQFFSQIKAIKLETSPECFISSSYTVKVFSEYIFVCNMENAGFSLLVFSKSGKFLFKPSLGKGPGEILGLRDYTFDPLLNELLILDSKKRLMRYSMRGEFLGSINMQWQAQSIEWISKNVYCLFVPFTSFIVDNVAKDAFILIDHDGKSLNTMTIAKTIKNSPFIRSLSFFQTRNQYYFHPHDNDNIYNVSSMGFKSAYSLDYGKLKLPEKYAEDLDLLQKYSEDYIDVYEIMAIKNFLLISYQYQRRLEYLIYNLINKTYILTDISKSKNSGGFTFGTSRNRLILKPDFISTSGQVIFSANAIEIRDFVKDLKEKAEGFFNNILNDLKNISENENPIILFCDL